MITLKELLSAIPPSTFVSSNADIMHVRKASPTQSYCFFV